MPLHASLCALLYYVHASIMRSVRSPEWWKHLEALTKGSWHGPHCARGAPPRRLGPRPLPAHCCPGRMPQPPLPAPLHHLRNRRAAACFKLLGVLASSESQRQERGLQGATKQGLSRWPARPHASGSSTRVQQCATLLLPGGWMEGGMEDGPTMEGRGAGTGWVGAGGGLGGGPSLGPQPGHLAVHGSSGRAHLLQRPRRRGRGARRPRREAIAGWPRSSSSSRVCPAAGASAHPPAPRRAAQRASAARVTPKPPRPAAARTCSCCRCMGL